MFANQIQVGRFNRALARLFRITGAPAPQLTPEITAVQLLVGEDPELRYLKEEKLCGGGFALPALAGNNAQFVLENPINSGIILVHEFFYVSAGRWRLNPQNGLAVGVVSRPTFVRDSRLYVGGLSAGGTTGIVRADNTNAPLAGAVFFAGPGGAARIDWPFVLTPGNQLVVTADLVNSASDIFFSWRERVGTPEELALNF